VASSKAGLFSNEAASTLSKLANSAAIAVENARLYQKSEAAAALEERHRIAAEMHDGLAQTLSCLNLKVEQATEHVETGDSKEAMAELKRISDAIHQAAQEVRRSIASLQEGPPARQSLQERLAEEANRFAEEGGPLIQLVSSLEAPFLLLSSECDQVLHVVREALLNACRHAQAAHIIIRLEWQDHQARVIVEDDGRGFDPKAPPVDESGHFGLSIMRARAARINGQIAVHSAPGQGTRVVLSWPIEQVWGGIESYATDSSAISG
jgi:signal transduction histidine kinase